MAGLINTAMQENPLEKSKLVTPGSTGFDAETRTVNPETETVSGQMDKLLGAESPYIQRARAKAAEVANSRGLLNSSMAAGAGEAAAIDAALPVAASDASTYSTVAAQNNAARNAGLAQTANAQNTAQLVGGEGQNQAALQTLKGSQASGLADVEANYKSLIQASEAASRALTLTQSQLGAIQADTSTSPEQKQAAVDKITQQLHNQLRVIGGIANIDIAGLLDFTGGG